MPKITNIGSVRGKVMRVPKTEPLVRLRELPKQNKIKKIYVDIPSAGRSIKDEFKSLLAPILKKAPRRDMGTPINSQCINIFMKTHCDNDLFEINNSSKLPSS